MENVPTRARREFIEYKSSSDGRNAIRFCFSCLAWVLVTSLESVPRARRAWEKGESGVFSVTSTGKEGAAG